MNKYRNKLTIMKQLIENENINTDECIVASTYMNAEFKYLNKKLSVANAMLNRFFNPQYQKQPSNRIVFHCFNEKEFNNTHSHIYCQIPNHLSFDVVIDKFQQIFRHLEDYPNRKHKLRVFRKTIDDQFAYCDYVLKKYDIYNPETHIVI